MRASPTSVEEGDRYVDLDDVRIRYRDEGSGPAVIFLHGWTLDLDMWEDQAAALRDGFRIIRVDRRGFGRSSGHPAVVDDVRDLGAFCLKLGIGRAAWVGMSQGARAALMLALDNSSLVSCLVLDGLPSMTSPPASTDELPYDHYCDVVRERGVTAFRREWSQHPLATLRTARPATAERLTRMLLRYPARDLCFPQSNRPAPAVSAAVLASFDRPVLLINGELDSPSRRQVPAELQPLLPRCETLLIAGAGHLCNLDDPEGYNLALRNFLMRYATCTP